MSEIALQVHKPDGCRASVSAERTEIQRRGLFILPGEYRIDVTVTCGDRRRQLEETYNAPAWLVDPTALADQEAELFVTQRTAFALGQLCVDCPNGQNCSTVNTSTEDTSVDEQG